MTLENRCKLPYYVYVLICVDGSFYTGYTKDVDKRAKSHACGKGARYTKMHKPRKIAHVEVFQTRGEAMHREKAIKKLSHAEKAKLINQSKKSSQHKKGQNQTSR